MGSYENVLQKESGPNKTFTWGLYFLYSSWNMASIHMRNSDKIADLERKINGYRLSRDDELKNVITLETRLNDCREENKELHEKISNSDEAMRNNSRMSREVKRLRKQMEEFRLETDHCKMFKDDLQDCKSSKDLLMGELEGQEEIIHRLKEKLKEEI